MAYGLWEQYRGALGRETWGTTVSLTSYFTYNYSKFPFKCIYSYEQKTVLICRTMPHTLRCCA